MAGTTTDYTIGVKSIYDATGLKTGVTTATQALNTLESEVGSSAQAMDADFRNVDTSVTSTFGTGGTLDTTVNTSGRKLKSAGKTIGTDFATSLTSGIASGDIAGSLGGIATSLAAFGGFTALGLGFGAALITGMIKSANEKKQEFIDAVNEGFAALEIKAKQTGEQIGEEILAGFEISKTIEDIGGGDAAKGLETATAAAQALNTETSDLITLVREGVNPATEDTNELLEDRLIAIADIAAGEGDFTEELSKESAMLEGILGLTEDRSDEVATLKGLGIAERDVLRDQLETHKQINGLVGQTADYSNSYANALERADAAARLLAGRRLPSSDAMNGL